MQEATHAVTPERGDAPMLTPMDSSAARQVYELARELAFRCDRGLFDPVPRGSTNRQVPPSS